MPRLSLHREPAPAPIETRITRHPNDGWPYYMATLVWPGVGNTQTLGKIFPTQRDAVAYLKAQWPQVPRIRD